MVDVAGVVNMHVVAGVVAVVVEASVLVVASRAFYPHVNRLDKRSHPLVVHSLVDSSNAYASLYRKDHRR